ncbi:hypothetical protein C2845_PM04G09110 [Panicum miliaceum]|uniref:Uncharacterized protein n=1 Tax=Panicum miliaceum TaxID=4540 RepID=A0A3L6QRD8_PANMI|nr:hypothetical protein C2845_PM04G09110 [Panicum miliaceum]
MQVSHILFVDSPVGAGFSFSREPKGYDVGDISSSLQLHEFLYKGYLVGNPMTGESIDFSAKVPFAHGFGIISDQLYETISKHCQGEDYTNPANALCAQAMNTFNNTYHYYLSYYWANDRRSGDQGGELP